MRAGIPAPTFVRVMYGRIRSDGFATVKIWYVIWILGLFETEVKLNPGSS